MMMISTMMILLRMLTHPSLEKYILIIIVNARSIIGLVNRIHYRKNFVFSVNAVCRLHQIAGRLLSQHVLLAIPQCNQVCWI